MPIVRPSSNSRDIEARLLFVRDQKSVDDAKKAVQEIRSEFEKSSVVLEKMDNVGETLIRVGAGMSTVGTSIIGLMVAGSQQYIRSMGMVEDQSALWLLNSRRIEDSQIRVGRVLTEAINPGMEFAANAAERLAQVAEENPWIAKAAAVAGVSLGGLGSLTSLVGIGMKSVGVLSDLRAGGGVQGALAGATMSLGTVTLLATSVILGAGIGAQLGNALGEKIYGEGYQQQNLGDALMTAVKILELPALQGLADKARGGDENRGEAQSTRDEILKFNRSLGEFVGASEFRTPETQSGTQALVRSGVVQAFEAFSNQMTEAERAFEQQRSNIIRQFGDQRTQLEEQYALQVSRSTRNFNQSQAFALQDFGISQTRAARNFQISEQLAEKSYYKQRASLSESFHESVQRSEEDHQRRLEDLRRQHERTIEDLEEHRDAYGIVKELQRYEDARQGEERSFSVESGRRSEDYSRQVQEMETNFKEQRALRLQQFQLQQADQQSDFNRQRARERAQFSQQMADMAEDHKRQQDLLDRHEKQTLTQLQEGYNNQVRLMRMAFIDRIRALDPIVLGDYQAYTRHLQALSTNFRSWLKSNEGTFLASGTKTATGTSSTGRQTGGYVWDSGLYPLAEDGKREFVLSNATTQKIEGLLGGEISQSKLIGMLSSRSPQSSRSSIQLSQTFKFDGAFSDRDKAWIQSHMSTVVTQSLEEVLG